MSESTYVVRVIILTLLGPTWPYLALLGPTWPYLALLGPTWPYLTLLDPYLTPVRPKQLFMIHSNIVFGPATGVPKTLSTNITSCIFPPKSYLAPAKKLLDPYLRVLPCFYYSPPHPERLHI
jgi:hypothetical protein